ncbi:hypothetical protein ACRCUN_17330 [Mycobacterium sp. LTG2003]
MNVSVRSYLMAGAAAATATTLALTPIQVTPDDIAVPAHSVSAEPQLSQAMVDLLAAASRMTAVLPAPPSGDASGATGAAPAAAVTAAPTALAIAPNLANTIDNIYVTFEPWVEYGFELGAYALGWIPWVGGWAGGLLMDGYNFGQSLVASAVFNFTDWLRGDGGIVANLVDFGVDVALSFVWLGIDVVGTFIPLPPLPYPPRPPLQGPFLAADLAETATLAATPTVASLPSLIGDLILPPVEAATDAAIAANNLTLATSQAVTEGVINAIEPVFAGLGLDVINQQININYDLLNSLSIQEVGFVNDLIGVPEGFLTDVLRNGEGPLRALGTQARFVVDSAVDHGSASVDALGNYVREQIDFFTPDLAADTETAGITGVPESVRTLVKSADETATESIADTVTAPDTDATETKGSSATTPARTLAKNVQDAVDKTVAKTTADVKKVSENIRDAVKDATKGAASTKTSDKGSETASDKTTDKKSESTKPAKKDKPAGADKADKKEKSEKSD